MLKIVLKKSCTKKSARKSAKNSAKKSVALKRVLVKVLKIVAKNRIFLPKTEFSHKITDTVMVPRISSFLSSN